MPLPATTDIQRLKGLASNDPKIVRGIYEDYFSRILSFVLKNSGNEDEAKDLFQDGLMVLFKKAKDPHFELKSGLFTYLYAICRNLWLKKLKRFDRERVTSVDEMEYTYNEQGAFVELDEEEWVHESRYQLYRRKFRELGEGCQKILELSLAGRSMAEIVEVMNLSSVGYARKRKFKCKEQLIKRIQEDGFYKELIQ